MVKFEKCYYKKILPLQVLLSTITAITTFSECRHVLPFLFTIVFLIISIGVPAEEDHF